VRFYTENSRFAFLVPLPKNLDRSFFRFVTIHAFDRQTDGRTDRRTAEFSSLDRVCTPCSAAKTGLPSLVEHIVQEQTAGSTPCEICHHLAEERENAVRRRGHGAGVTLYDVPWLHGVQEW